MEAFLSVPSLSFNPEDFKFSNINNILDNISLLYQKLIASGEGGDVFEPVSKTYQDKFIENWQTTSPTPNQNRIFTSRKSEFLSKLATDKEFARKVANSKNDFKTQWLAQVKTGIYFSENSINLFNQASQYESKFPFLFKINIPSEKRGPLAKLFSEAGLLDAINTHAASLIAPNPDLARNITVPATGNNRDSAFSYSTYADFFGGVVNGDGTNNFNMLADIKLKTFNMHFMEKPYIDEEVGNPQSDRYIPDFSVVDLFLDSFGDIGKDAPKNVFIYDEEEKKIGSQLLSLLEKLKGQKFNKSLSKLLFEGNLMRSPHEIHAGALAHQETLMYEIAKYKILDTGEERYVQSIFIPIMDQDDLLYLDTQVIPYQDYFYKIFAHKVIVGTKYRIDVNKDIEYVGKVGQVFKHEYEIEPYLQFVRVPYYNTRYVNVSLDQINYSRIEDLPPLPPQVQVIPYRNISSKILFLFNNSVGRKKMAPVGIFAGDENSFKSIALSQGVDYISTDGFVSNIMFGGDDVAVNYEVFRTETKPTSYRQIGEDPTLSNGVAGGDNRSFIDSIIPNKDYYYTFRAIDVHGKLSNPTEVYKIRMIKASNSAPYLKIEVLNIFEEARKEKSKKFSTAKDFQKYLLIKPSDFQNTVSYPDLQTGENGQAVGDYESEKVVIGGEKSVFGKNYKLRITSKLTGKKIDVNFTFTNPKDIINKL